MLDGSENHVFKDAFVQTIKYAIQLLGNAKHLYATLDGLDLLAMNVSIQVENIISQN
jgi:hypothetical protein